MLVELGWVLGSQEAELPVQTNTKTKRGHQWAFRESQCSTNTDCPRGRKGVTHDNVLGLAGRALKETLISLGGLTVVVQTGVARQPRFGSAKDAPAALQPLPKVEALNGINA